MRANQPYYLGCVFAVIREWLAFGKPATSVTQNDFREWAQILDWIVQNIFHAAPLLDGHQSAQERVSNPALNFLRLVALEVEALNKLDEALFAHQIVDLCEESGIEIPGLKSANSDDACRKVGVVLKRAFGDLDVVQVDGFTVKRAILPQPRVGGGGTYTTKSYRFSR